MRKAPTRNQIAEAEALYKELNKSGAQIASKNERFKFKNWSLKAKLQFMIQASLIAVLVTGQIFVSADLREEPKKLAIEKGTQLANEIIDSANMLMVVGQFSEVNNRKLLMHKVGASGGVKSAQLVRTKQVMDLYGPGLPEEKIKDDAQRQAIESKKQSITFMNDASGAPVLRVITPYMASKDFHGTDCTGCHAVPEGTVLGASDVVVHI